jgi:hypothetical protein
MVVEVAQPIHDLPERPAGGRGEGASGVAQLVHAEALDPGGPGGRLPDPPVEITAPQVLALAAQEHERLRRLGRVARQVLGQGRPPGQAAEHGVGAYLPLLTCREDSGGAPRPGNECTTLIVVTHEQAQVELVLDLNDQVV